MRQVAVEPGGDRHPYGWSYSPVESTEYGTSLTIRAGCQKKHSWTIEGNRREAELSNFAYRREKAPWNRGEATLRSPSRARLWSRCPGSDKEQGRSSYRLPFSPSGSKAEMGVRQRQRSKGQSFSQRGSKAAE